jgi:hypothetical protein
MALVVNNEIIVYSKDGDTGTVDTNSTLALTNGLPVGYDLYDFNTNEKVGKLILLQNLLTFDNLNVRDSYSTQNRYMWFKDIKVNNESKGPGSLCTTITDTFLDAPFTLNKGEVIQGYSIQGSISNLGTTCIVNSIINPNDPNYGSIIKIQFH